MELLKPGEISHVPYAESSAWTKGFHSPYYKKSHFDFRIAVRKIIDEKVNKGITLVK
jgi:hypothetical protein